MRVETYSHPGRHVAPSAPDDLPIRARREGKDREADVCLIVEGAYPHVSGGVSTWVHGLIRRRPDLRFCVVAILPEPPAPVAKYAGLPNLDALHHLYLSELHGDGGWRRPRSFDQVEFDKAVDIFLSAGGLAELTKIIRLLAPLIKARRTAELLDSTLAWNLVCDLYDREMPHESFLHFFWAWRALFGGLIATLSFPLPPARVYHTVSTGYAGLLAARASVETGRPAIIPSMASTLTNGASRSCRRTGSSTRWTKDLRSRIRAAICATSGRRRSRAMHAPATRRVRRSSRCTAPTSRRKRSTGPRRRA